MPIQIVPKKAGPKGYSRKPNPKSFAEVVYSTGDGSEYQKDKVTKSGKRLGGYNKGGKISKYYKSGGNVITGR